MKNLNHCGTVKVWLFCLVASGLSLSAIQAAPQAGDGIFQSDFGNSEALRVWQISDSQHVRLTRTEDQLPVLFIEAPPGGSSNVLARLNLPLESLRGARLKFSARVKAAGVTSPPKPWNGVKFMLHATGPQGDQWPQASAGVGTFDWTHLQFTARVPRDATSAALVLGLEAVLGQVWFDHVEITVLNPPRARPTAPPAGPPFKGHDLPRLRGAMIGQVSAEDLREFGENWRANHVRWQLIWGGFPASPADNANLTAYDAWLEGELKRLDDLLPVCEQAGLKVLIDLHTPPGGRAADNTCRIFTDPACQAKFIEWWDKISRRYRGNRTVWGYDLVNEPVEGNVPAGLMDWQALATATARVVRKNDPDHAIIIEPAPWGGPEAIENLEPIPVPGVVYSVHVYVPHQFTHQGIHGNPAGVRYPGMVAGQQWDRERLRRALLPVVEFQRDHGVHIYIGEFSAIRWAPDDSAWRYLRDCIELFEENGWDWAYHAFREWDGWSVEHGPDQKDRKRSPTPTNREQLLRAWFAKNAEKPSR
ncbi:MAG: cellulase family glycosylhydrolase [Verrucomicrobia bacterium]|nr:cellulase family glycosylhydrolase [Verrucomicrobiota bacterium]